MDNYCAFCKGHTCVKWIDYELTRLELEEVDNLCHGHWIEIENLQQRVHQLEDVLKQAGLEIPPGP